MQHRACQSAGVGITCHCLSWTGSLTCIYRRFFHVGQPRPGRWAACGQRQSSAPWTPAWSCWSQDGWEMNVYLSAVFRNKLILLNWFFNEGAPPCNIWWSQKQVLKTHNGKTVGKMKATRSSSYRVYRITGPNFNYKVKQCLPVWSKSSSLPFWGLFGCCSSCRTPLCCPSGQQHHRSCTDLGHTPSQPGSRDTAWCCTGSYICSLGSGSGLKRK